MLGTRPLTWQLRSRGNAVGQVDICVADTTGELQKLIPELIDALGGEMAFGAAADSEPASAVREPVTADADDDGPPF